MMLHIGDGRPWSNAQTDQFLQRQKDHLQRHGVCFGAVAPAESDPVIGLAGMQKMDTGDFELGWWIWKDQRGRGLAAEAVRPFLQHARDMMRLDRLVAVIDPPNSASIRVAEKRGMVFEQRMRATETLAARDDLRVVLYALSDLRKWPGAGPGCLPARCWCAPSLPARRLRRRSAMWSTSRFGNTENACAACPGS